MSAETQINSEGKNHTSVANPTTVVNHGTQKNDTTQATKTISNTKKARFNQSLFKTKTGLLTVILTSVAVAISDTEYKSLDNKLILLRSSEKIESTEHIKNLKSLLINPISKMLSYIDCKISGISTVTGPAKLILENESGKTRQIHGHICAIPSTLYTFGETLKEFLPELDQADKRDEQLSKIIENKDLLVIDGKGKVRQVNKDEKKIILFSLSKLLANETITVFPFSFDYFFSHDFIILMLVTLVLFGIFPVILNTLGTILKFGGIVLASRIIQFFVSIITYLVLCIDNANRERSMNILRNMIKKLVLKNDEIKRS